MIRSRSRCGSRGTARALFGLVAFVAVGLAADSIHAHTQAGSLGSGASATDYYQVLCSDDGTGPPASLSIQVLDSAPAAAPLVSVQARNGSALASATDPTDADANASPLIHVNAGAGTVYDVLVDKSGAGVENYVLTFHCVTGPNGTGLHTGTDVVTRQNQ